MNNTNFPLPWTTDGYTTTATAGGTTTLTVTSLKNRYFTGSSAQTIVLPVTSTLSTSYYSVITNLSTGNLTINSSGGNLVQTMTPNTVAVVMCILITGTTAASWSVQYSNLVKSGLTQISRLRSNATSLTASTPVNVATTTNLTLSVGDWVIYGTVGFLAGTGTTITSLVAAISKTSATLPALDTFAVPTAGEYTVNETFPSLAIPGDFTLPFQGVPVSLTTSTTFYLVGQATFAVSTLGIYGSMYAIAV